jgi:outer membrane biosynthesis protein TonB
MRFASSVKKPSVFGLCIGIALCTSAFANFNNFELALLETSSLAQIELGSLPCTEQVAANETAKRGIIASTPEELNLWVSEGFANAQTESVNSVQNKVFSKYPDLSKDQLADVRATAEYIILPTQIVACTEPVPVVAVPEPTPIPEPTPTPEPAPVSGPSPASDSAPVPEPVIEPSPEQTSPTSPDTQPANSPEVAPAAQPAPTEDVPAAPATTPETSNPEIAPGE